MGRWPSRWLGWRSLPLANLFHLLMDQDQGSLRPADKAATRLQVPLAVLNMEYLNYA
uniref:Uncharacterized protein n=1 Tax=Oryza meridionalis TaxID=40149 RepID=A0A0E0CPK4_9ORYZ